MSNRNEKGQGYRIYKDHGTTSSRLSQSMMGEPNRFEVTAQNEKQMEITLMQKLHAQTVVVGFLMYNREIKGIRFFDPVKRKFIDIAPWHLNHFSISKLKLMGVRELELFRHEAGNSEGTVVVEFLTKYEVSGYFRANRMISDNLAAALSGILKYMQEEEYQSVIHYFANDARGE